MDVISLFSSAGIGELRLDHSQFNVVLANEIIKKRADCYKFFYPNTIVVNNDILLDSVKDQIISVANEKQVKLLLATPPCQGLSSLGKNKVQDDYINDKRNFLVLEVFEIIDKSDFDFILIENVPRFLEMYFPYKNDFYLLEDIIKEKYSDKYRIDIDILNAKDYGIPQSRPRAIIKLYKKGYSWSNPPKEREITLREAIGHLPSLEAGEGSDIPWHNAKKELDRLVLAIKHTATGCSAMKNEVYYPKKDDGTKIKGFHNTFKRMEWEKPAPARTTYSGSISSHNNIHPGRKQSDGTYSDARVLTLLETFIVSSIPEQINFPKNATPNFIRTIIGESIPPLMLKKILNLINK